LVFIEGATHPHVVVLFLNGVVRREGHQRCYSLQTSQFLWEFVFDEDATLGGPEVGPPVVIKLVVKGLVDDSYPWPLLHRYPDQTCDVVEVALCKAFCSVQRIYPYYHFLFVKFIWKFIEVPVSVRGMLAKHLLLFPQIVSIGYLVHFIILQQHLLGDVLLINHVR